MVESKTQVKNRIFYDYKLKVGLSVPVREVRDKVVRAVEYNSPWVIGISSIFRLETSLDSFQCLQKQATP